MIVHILHHGFPYCTQDIPLQPGNLWVPVQQYKDSNCYACIIAMLDGSLPCNRCSAILVDGLGRSLGSTQPSNGGVLCYPECGRASEKAQEGRNDA